MSRSGEGCVERGGVVTGDSILERGSEKGVNEELLEGGLLENPSEEEDVEEGGYEGAGVVGGTAGI